MNQARNDATAEDGPEATPRISLDDHRGNTTEQHINQTLDNYNDYLTHTIDRASRQSGFRGDGGGRVNAERAIQAWLEFALGADVNRDLP